MNLDNFGMDTITLAGPLEAKLDAIRDAGFSQVLVEPIKGAVTVICR